MKENNGQQLPLSGFESSWIYQRTFVTEACGREGHHSWVFTTWAQAMYTFVVGHWCENTAIALFKLLYLHMGLLEVIQFQILFSLLMRSRERFELRELLICSRYFFLSSRWLKKIKTVCQGHYFNAPQTLGFCILYMYLTDYRLCPFFVTWKYALNDAFQSLINAVLLEGRPRTTLGLISHI